MLLVDKYRPLTLDKLDYHLDMAHSLKNLAASNDFPHLMFYGPSGAGKKTRIMSLLREIFGSSVEKIRIEKKEFPLASKSSSNALQVTVISSLYHIELSPVECGFHDRIVVQEVIKQIAQNQQMDMRGTARPFKVLLLNEVDLLTKAAQHALRRTMEKYIRNCRIVMHATSLTNIIEPLKSRCLCIRVAAPETKQVVQILQNVAEREGFNLPLGLGERIASHTNRNLRRSLLILEAMQAKHTILEGNLPLQYTDWELFIQQLAKCIIEQQTPEQLLLVRGKLYELIAHCIPPTVIIKTLTSALLAKVDNELTHHVALLAAEYEHRMKLGSNSIFHLEAFVAKFMELYKKYLLSNFLE